MRDEFSRFHPLNNFIYFVAVIAFSTIYFEPILIILSLICGLIYSLYLNNKGSLRRNMLIILPISLFAAVVNIAFNHNGMTILAYFPSGNPLTLESIIFSICAAGMLAAVILWFFCFNKVITSDKFIYLFGRIFPSLALILSMVLRYIPMFKEQHHRVITAQKSLHGDSSNGIILKLKHSLNVFSIMFTWSLENSILTADSMNSRGYGIKGRTAFTYYKFYRRDGILLAVQIALIILQITFTALGCSDITFYPQYFFKLSFVKIFGYITYALFCLLPITINLTEDIKWSYFQSKI